jgi:hypothetical protein
LQSGAKAERMMKFNNSGLREISTDAQRITKPLTPRPDRPLLEPLFVGAATENPMTMSTTRSKSMKTKFIVAVAAFAVACSATTSFATQPLGSAFAYQGRLNDGGAPANGQYDMIFNLYDAPTNGNVIGSFSIFGAVPVSNGLFTVELNADNEFGTNAFNGQARWLQIGVRTNNNNAMNPWIFLDPRQPLDCAPQAMFAQNASNAMTASIASTVADGSISSSKLAPGAVAWTNISGIPPNAAIPYSAGPGLSLGWFNQFSVNFGGSGAANTAARSDHNHFGSVWGGNVSFGSGLGATNGANNGAGLYGQQGTGSGFPYIFGNPAGVWGESSQGSGVWGASATYAGVRGVSLGTNGYGVYGGTVTTNGANSGVCGQSASVSGTGVRGNATASSGVTSGVRGESYSSGGYGVLGIAFATNGYPMGVAGQSVSPGGVGVRGWATALTGETAGVRGDSASGDGTGVMGMASALWGDATGVYGQSAAVHGAGVYGKATFVSGVGPNYGVVGQSDSLWGYVVYGHAAASSGINFGVVGESHSVGGVGVVARNTNGVGLKVEGRSIIQSDGVALKVEGSGIIQSDADSVIWIPGSASLGFDGHRTYVIRAGGPRITFPLAVPAVLYGQKTTLKSIEVSFGAENDFDGDVRITGTCVYSGDYDYPDPLVHKDNNTHYPVKYPDSYTVQLNYPLGESSPPLNLSIDALAPGHIPDYLTYIYIYGIKLRFSHK